MKFGRLFFQVLPAVILLSCNSFQQISRSAKRYILNDSALRSAHVGISIYETASGKYLYNFQGDRYFVPASNTKLPTCYAAMKYLGDSLTGLRYGVPDEVGFKNSIVIQPSGDPTFLHEDYRDQRVFAFLQRTLFKTNALPFLLDTIWRDQGWGSGWSWNDYRFPYMAERSSWPIFGNVIKVRINEEPYKTLDTSLASNYHLLKTQSHYFNELVNAVSPAFSPEDILTKKIAITRDVGSNTFYKQNSDSPFNTLEIPFVPDGSSVAIKVLEDTFKTSFNYAFPADSTGKYVAECKGCGRNIIHVAKWNRIYSQPTDSLLKPMMHRSDNFFAEQSLLMVSNELLGEMNDAKIIDTLLRTDFRDLPQRPRWADGSGLSRYNLFSPQDFVYILDKMKAEFGMARLKEILPTGGEGTLTSYYLEEKGALYAKTGTLSGVVALSGFLYTRKNRLLIFSVLVNHHRSSAADVRRAVEHFIKELRAKY